MKGPSSSSTLGLAPRCRENIQLNSGPNSDPVLISAARNALKIEIHPPLLASLGDASIHLGFMRFCRDDEDWMDGSLHEHD